MGLVESKTHREHIEIEKLENLNKILVNKLDKIAAKNIQIYSENKRIKQTFDKFIARLNSDETIKNFIGENDQISLDDEFEKKYLKKFILYLQEISE